MIARNRSKIYKRKIGKKLTSKIKYNLYLICKKCSWATRDHANYVVYNKNLSIYKVHMNRKVHY